MKKNNIFKTILMGAAALASVACSDDAAYIGGVDTDRIEVPGGDVIYVTDHNGNRHQTAVEFRDEATFALNVTANRPLADGATVTFTVDPQVLTDYNAANGTSFSQFPAGAVAFENGGIAEIAAGDSKGSISYTLTSDGSLDHTATYAIPVRITVSGGPQLGSVDSERVILVRDMTGLPTATKYVTDADGNLVEGIKIFSVLETNDTNPLNVLRYKLKNSGKYMVDCLVMFSGNINYDQTNGKVYFHANTQISNILANYDKYLKPLKDRGIKVVMGVMCNHDRACVANLAPATAKAFAADLDNLCKAYNLDGIFWDDEYCSTISPAPEGFVTPGNEAWSRLAYEFWKLDPTRWNLAYGYSTTARGTDIDGVPAGQFISYVLPDYAYSMPDYSSAFNGMKPSQMGAYSNECAQGRFKTKANFKSMREAGRGAMMMFAMDPWRSNVARQDEVMGQMAEVFYDDEVVVDESCKYPADHK